MTDTYLKNAGFESSPIFDGTNLGTDKKSNATATSGSALAACKSPNVYTISDWTTITNTNSDYARTFTMPYNTTLYVKSNGTNGGQQVVSPKNESSVTEGNKSLLFVETNWCPNVTLGVKQTATLPTGVYKLVFDAYVNTNLDKGKSLCGVKYGDLSIYKWPSELNKWAKLEIIFNVATETNVDFSMGYLKSASAGSGSSPFLFVDNIKLYRISETALTSKDVTDKITNPNADTKDDWNYTGNVDSRNGFDGKSGYFNPGNWNAKSWEGSLYQTLSNMPNGIYNLKAAIQSEDGVISLLVANGSVSEKAPANGTTKGTIKSDGSVVEEGQGVGGWNYAQTSVLVTDRTLKIGAWSAAFAEHKWTNIDNFTLSYLEGSDVYAAQKLLSDKIDEAQAMIDGGKYKGTDALQEKITEANSKLYTASTSELESTKTALQVAINNLLISNAPLEKPASITIKNPDMATTDGWTGAGKFGHPTNNENPGSNVTRPYFETWVLVPNHQTAKSFSQIVKDCPAGAYELKAAVTATYQVAGNDIHNNNGVYLYIKDGEKVTKTPCKTGDAAQYFSVVVNHEVEGDLEIGLQIDETTGVNWVAFDNFSLNCYGIGNYDALVKKNYDAILATAKATKDDNVIGDEKTKLESLIAATPTDYVTAANDLQLATINFNEAKVSYQALVDAKKLEQKELAYASKAKYTEFTTSKEEATATTAADAETKANAIISARRAYVESNGKAEGVVGAEDCTSKVINPTFTASDGKGSLDGWNRSQTGGEEGALNGEIWTNADGKKVGYYYDYNNNGANNQRVYQEVTGLTPGKYIVTVKARAKQGFWMYLRINDNDKNATDIYEIGNTGGVFDRGWNDYTAEFTVGADGKVKIEVGNYKPNGVDNKAGWFGFGHVRLVRLSEAVTLDEAANNVIEAKEAADVTLKRKFVANKWNTLVLPFAVSDADVKTTFGAEAKIVEYRNADDANINFTTSTKGIEANVPVLIMPAAVNAENTYTFNGVSIVVADPKADGTNYSFVGSYKPYDLVNDDYMLYADKWWKTETGDKYKIKAFRAYIKANGIVEAAKQLNLVIDGQTTGLKLNTVNGNIEGETYNIAGQRVANSYKGLIIKNGKKIIKK